ncbi:hypothetical protein HYH02_000729 [Chlamydomonas schloesseri]|uniref:Uncharacterized protein n=1 Tax=Chlamydomonas schloesseri TaxID=2026947 RepID=A0A836BDL9_9CHLO|nr:hypothetical protein HYH02_000729 [Chlamydomonas schloesseri]|eukprot:KAG2454899.1 hypothetical protein HYH02_000729 [Chlamydomonas schloesseri]
MNSLLARKGVALTFSRRISPILAVPCLTQRPSSSRAISKVRASKEPERDSAGESASDFLAEASSRAAAFWEKLDTQQRVYTVVAGSALVLFLPQVVGVLLIPLERLLIGGLLAVEEAFALLVLASARVIALIGLVALVLVGAYLFLFPKSGAGKK